MMGKMAKHITNYVVNMMQTSTQFFLNFWESFLIFLKFNIIVFYFLIAER